MNEFLLHANDRLQKEAEERQQAEMDLTEALEYQKNMQEYLIQWTKFGPSWNNSRIYKSGAAGPERKESRLRLCHAR